MSQPPILACTYPLSLSHPNPITFRISFGILCGRLLPACVPQGSQFYGSARTWVTERLTKHKSPRSDPTERTVYDPPLLISELQPPDAPPDPHKFEGRKQILAAEYAIEILPTIEVNRPCQGVVTYDGDIAHAWKRGEAFERFFPKLSVRFIDLRSDGQ